MAATIDHPDLIYLAGSPTGIDPRQRDSAYRNGSGDETLSRPCMEVVHITAFVLRDPGVG